MSEGDVQLLGEGTGPKVRTYEVDVPQPVDASGNAVAEVTREQQVVTLAGESGDSFDQPMLREIADGIAETNRLLELVLGALS